MNGERPKGGTANILIGNLDIDAPRRTVTRNGNSIKLTWAEFDLLWYMASNKNRVITRDELFEKLLEREYDGLDRTIDLRISRLRRKIESDDNTPQLIHSVRSEGYCLIINPNQEERDES